MIFNKLQRNHYESSQATLPVNRERAELNLIHFNYKLTLI